MASSRRWTREPAPSCHRSTGRRGTTLTIPPMSPAWRRLAHSETDDPPAASTRRPGRPGTPHGDAEGLAHPAPLAALERVAAREPRDEPDPHVRLGPLLAGAGRPDVRAAPGRVRLRVLEVAGGQPRGARPRQRVIGGPGRGPTPIPVS